MSHLRAPAARADRREGGRHGRPVTRTVPSLPETRLRPQLLRLAVLPPTSVALGAGAAVLFTVRSTGARPGPVLWAVLAGAFAVTLAGIAIAAVAAGRAARSVHDRIGVLRRGTARREAELRALVDALRQGEAPPPQKPHGGPPEGADEVDLLAADLARAHDEAVAAVVQAAQLSSQTGSEQKLEVFVNLARRLQSLVHREISTLDELENDIEDPDLLKGIFHVDHLATRVRRHAENLAVLGGAVSRRQWSNPVCMTEVLRSSIAEVEQYSRVKLAPPIEGRLRGHAVADVIHLLAELVENATLFSAPQTQVLLRANLVTSGLAVEVEDRGLGMPVGEQVRMNTLLADPDQVNVASLLADGRIGLYVVSQLARRHGITVRLQTNIYGGVQAVVLVPQTLLGTSTGASGTSFGALDTGMRPPAPAPYPSGAAPSLPDGGHGHAVAPAQNGGGTHRAPAVSGGGTHRAPAVSGGRGEPVRGVHGTGVRRAPSPVTGLLGGPARPGDTRRRDGGMHPVAGADARDARRVPGTAGGVLPPRAVPRMNGAPGPVTPVSGGDTPMSVPGPVSGGDMPVSVPAPMSGGDTPMSVPGPVSGGDMPVSVPAPMSGDGTPMSAPVPAPRGDTPMPMPMSGGDTPIPGPGGELLPAHAPTSPGDDVRAVEPADGDHLDPLPRRTAREGQDTPAEAVPGIRPAERAAMEAGAGAPPVPRAGVVRGTMERPRLPRRRAQEHLVPQLRGGPLPRQESEHVAGHDPGLMAAFRRGTGLAESEQRQEPAAAEPARPHDPHPPGGAHPQDVSGATEARPVLLPGQHLTLRHDGSEPAG
ncbi:ATP-binding protein [Streptomyces sp. NPDC056112]|uniref:sensor histidine kinase n=1 Tax=Streptomyces sp. NPDC056112 TaxID=3345715 RepID=UPI0035E0F9B5